MNNIADELSLNGIWKIIYDPDNKGRILNWQVKANFLKRNVRETNKTVTANNVEEINVPSCWEEYKQDYEGVAWYGKSFTVPVDWENKSVRVNFGAVNYRSEVWLNGEAVGFHEGGYTDFEFEIGDLLKYDKENFLVVRVISPIITRDITIDGLGKDEMPHWRGALTAGIWQSVKLIATGSIYIKNIFIQPDIYHEKVEIDLEVMNNTITKRKARMNSKISTVKTDQMVSKLEEDITIKPGLTKYSYEMYLDDCKLWSPDNPYLYYHEVKIIFGKDVFDKSNTRFGMREFTVKNERFYLNDEEIKLKAAFSEGLYPHSLAYPQDVEMIKKEIQLAKDAGLNMIRPWRKPQPPVVYNLADEMGMLFMGTIPVECMNRWPRLTPYTETRIANEVREMIIRDRNHPSIVIWEMFNEILRHGLERMKHKISLLAREYDPQRIILDESGGFSSFANLYLPYSNEPQVFNDVHSYPGAPLDNEGYNSFLALGKTRKQLKDMGINESGVQSLMKPNLLTNISEIGYGSLPDLQENVNRYEREGNLLTPDYRYHKRLLKSYKEVLEKTAVAEIYNGIRDFCLESQEIHAQANKYMIEAARLNPDVKGIGIHALTDGDWVLGAGLLDIFRNTKKPYYTAQEIFNTHYLAIRTNKKNSFLSDGIDFKITCVNDRSQKNVKLVVKVKSETNEEIYKHEQLQLIEKGINEVFTKHLNLKIEGSYIIEACLMSLDDELLTSNTYSFNVVDVNDFIFSGLKIAIIDDHDVMLKDYLANKDIDVIKFKSNLNMNIPVLITGFSKDNSAIYKKVKEWVARGGTVIWLDPPEGNRVGNIKWIYNNSDIIPYKLEYVASRGVWNPNNHIIKKHPIFSGLPVDCMMDQNYQNIVARRSISNLGNNWIVGVIGYHYWFGKNQEKDYRGISAAYSAADLVVKSFNNGKYIFSTISLVENLGKDSFADKILYNMIKWILNESNFQD